MTNITKHYLVSGRVQGVGFRAYTEKEAVRRDIRGWVRNLSDGRVEVLAQGPKARIEDFEQELRSGPPASVVEDLNSQPVNEESPLQPFYVAESGEQPWSK